MKTVNITEDFLGVEMTKTAYLIVSIQGGKNVGAVFIAQSPPWRLGQTFDPLWPQTLAVLAEASGNTYAEAENRLIETIRERPDLSWIDTEAIQ